MIDFQILILTCLTLLTIAMFIFFYFLVIKSKHDQNRMKLELQIPESPVLHGEKALKALNEFVNEIKERKGEEFTDKQTAALLKLAEGLIESIETETEWKKQGGLPQA